MLFKITSCFIVQRTYTFSTDQTIRTELLRRLPSWASCISVFTRRTTSCIQCASKNAKTDTRPLGSPLHRPRFTQTGDTQPPVRCLQSFHCCHSAFTNRRITPVVCSQRIQRRPFGDFYKATARWLFFVWALQQRQHPLGRNVLEAARVA